MISLELETQEAMLVSQTFDTVPIVGPDAKRDAANIQVKIVLAAQAAQKPPDVVDSEHDPNPEE